VTALQFFPPFRLYDLDDDKRHEFTLPELVNHVQLFAGLAGYQKRIFKEEDPVNKGQQVIDLGSLSRMINIRRGCLAGRRSDFGLKPGNPISCLTPTLRSG
jgi:hypothetical protein